LEAIREEKSVSQIAAENGIRPNQIYKWTKQALEDFAELLKRTAKESGLEKPDLKNNSTNCIPKLGT
jgi:transposase-like protein